MCLLTLLHLLEIPVLKNNPKYPSNGQVEYAQNKVTNKVEKITSINKKIVTNKIGKKTSINKIIDTNRLKKYINR